MTPKSEEQPPPSGEERFTALWDAYAGRVFAYTCRHVDHHSAQEVVSETFLVAWRRLDEVPEQGTVVAEGTSPPSPKVRRALGVALAVAVLAVALDQGSKALAVAQLTSGERVPLVGDLFGLSLVYNPGAAFSLGSGSTWIFTLVGLLAAIAVVVFAVRLRGARWVPRWAWSSAARSATSSTGS